MVTTNWSYTEYGGNLEVQVPSKSFYDAWRFLSQLYGVPVTVREDKGGYRHGSFTDKLSGMTVELRETTNCAVIYLRKPKS